MEMITMTNGQLGFSSLEICSLSGFKPYSSSGFLSSWRPFSVAPLSEKKMTTFGLGLRVKAVSDGDSDNGLVGGGVLGKEFEFKPSFDDYLKAMESVKSVREKKQTRKLSERNSKDELEEGNSTSMVRIARDRGELGDNVDGGIGRKDVVGYKERGAKESNVKFRGKESNAYRNGKRDVKGPTRDREQLEKRSRRTNSGSEDRHEGHFKRNHNAQVRAVVVDDVRRSGSTIGIPEIWRRKGEEDGVSSNKVGGKLVRNHTQIDKKTNGEFEEKKGLRRRTDESFLGDDKDLEVERAAFKSLEEYNDANVRPRTSKRDVEERLQQLANCLNGADINMPEWMFSKMMRSAKIKYTDHSIVRLIQILGNLGNWRRVLQVVEWLQMRERFKPLRLRYIYTTALNVLGKAQRPVEALNLFYVMQQQMSSYPDSVAYHCIAVALGQAGHLEQLFDVIDSMRSPPKKKFKTALIEKWDPRLEPNIVVYNAVLNACVQKKQWEGAFWVLQQLKQQGLQPSTATYGLIMEVMFACGKYNLVHEFFRKVQKSSSPNALVYKVLVNTLWKEGKTDEAVLAVEDMERRGIVGFAALYYDLARCLCSAGRCEEALLQIKKICKVANKPLVVTYTGLIQACLDNGNIKNAEYIFHQMKHFCSPNLITCNIMLKAYLDHGLFEDAKELFHKLTGDSNHITCEQDYKARIMPDIYTFNTMLDGCIAEKRWDDFGYVYRKMLNHRFHFNGKRHLRMILDASRAGKVEPLEMTWKHLAQTDRIPPPNLIKERFRILLEEDDYKSALACITTNPMEESPAYHKVAWLNLFKENAERIRTDTLVQLKHEVAMLIARTNPPNPVLQNLLTSCNDFLNTRVKVTESNMTEIVYTAQSQTASKS
ncbi:pentatricopeptide repeat-containing protein At1g30610, chloroplastic [Mercurialis annua]|uniref:pentatricopeptide repeat-containing protein At1g30610, chloroplastic n=1 Tax=Mercurialis annua TaxID=3986 RepID=UPI00215EEF28|nr:pentatricopeptide repeat-containing protein At1g30610, chloroplastic [Mercurialis annua]